MIQVTVQLHQLVSNFTASQTDYILGHDDMDCHELEDNTESFLKDLRNLLNHRRGQVVPTLRRLFSEGFTMMMLPSEHFDVLETASRADEDFAVVVKDGSDTLCILCKAECQW
jgi:hypothetical protein